MKHTEKQMADMYEELVLSGKMKEDSFLRKMARENDCYVSEVREILENQDVPVKKAGKCGRKPYTPEQKAEAAELKKEKRKAREEAKKEIPESVKIVVVERIESLKTQIEVHQKMIDKNRAEMAELEAYLDGRSM